MSTDYSFDFWEFLSHVSSPLNPPRQLFAHVSSHRILRRHGWIHKFTIRTSTGSKANLWAILTSYLASQVLRTMHTHDKCTWTSYLASQVLPLKCWHITSVANNAHTSQVLPIRLTHELTLLIRGLCSSITSYQKMVYFECIWWKPQISILTSLVGSLKL